MMNTTPNATPNHTMTNNTPHTTAPRAMCRRFRVLSHRATFIATLAAASVVFAQAPTPPTPAATGAAQMKPTEGQPVAETFTVQFQDTDILQALQMLSMQRVIQLLPEEKSLEVFLDLTRIRKQVRSSPGSVVMAQSAELCPDDPRGRQACLSFYLRPSLIH